MRTQLEMKQRAEQRLLQPQIEVQYPLAAELYYRLGGFARRNGCGEVIIANQGELSTGYEVADDRWGTRIQIANWGETYRINCPFCNDTKHRLWLPHIYGQPERDPQGGLMPGAFYGICFNEDCLNKGENRADLWYGVFGTRNRNLRGNTPTIDRDRGVKFDGRFEEKPPPGATVPLADLPDNTPAVWYLMGERRFTREHMTYYQLSLCTQPSESFRPALGRIIAPIFFHGKHVGWQGRYVGKPPNKFTPPYYTMPGMKKSWLLYNYDRAKESRFVVVTEGITDVWRLGDCSVAILGKEISTAQRNLIEYQWGGHDKVVIVCLDPDAMENSAMAIQALQNAGVNIVRVHLAEGSDPADYDKPVLWNIIRQQVEARGIKTLPESI